MQEPRNLVNALLLQSLKGCRQFWQMQGLCKQRCGGGTGSKQTTLCFVSRVFWGRRHHIGQHGPFLHNGCKSLCPALPHQLNVSDKAFVMTCPRPFET